MVSKKEVGAASAAKKKTQKIVDPMLVNAAKAEKDNGVLDEALADLEMNAELEETTEDFAAESFISEMPEEADNLEEILSVSEEMGLEEHKKKSARKTEKAKTEVEEKNEDDKKVKKTRKERKAEKIAARQAEEDLALAAIGRGEKPPKGFKKNGKRKMRTWKKVVILLAIVLLCALGYAGWYAYSVLHKTTSVFEGNPLDIFVSQPLAKDENNRTNVLIFGTSEDEEGHGGAMLADSILVISFDQDTKEAKTFSIPRDLWVNYTVAGEDTLFCSVGYKGKINAEYMCALAAFDENTDAAARYFARKISEVTGVNIQYYVAVDWTVLRSVVDTLGGIDVDVWATDENGISDICQQIKMPKGMNYNLDGDTVLRLARARGACAYGAGSIQTNYGLQNSNFDREKNQQRIINAIKDKALTVGVLADPTKVLSMIDALGQNVKTNITMSEVRTILDVALGLSGDIESIETQNLFSTGMIGTQSSVVPAGAPLDSNSAALYNYTNIHNYINEQLNPAPVETEEATAGEIAEPEE